MLQPVVRQQQPVGRGRGGEPSRHPHTGVGKGADHLSEPGVLAAAGEIGQAEPLQRQHQRRLVQLRLLHVSAA